MLFPEQNSGLTGMFFKIVTEVRGFRKTQQVSYFLDGGG